MIMWQHRYYHAIWMAMNIAVPAAIGLLIDRVWGMILIAGLLRVVLVHQGTFCINSVCHIIGTQPWSSKDTSRDSWISALFTFGEGYHNYHHTFAADYRNGLMWYQFDPGKWAIWTGEKLKMCSGLKRTTEQQRMKKRIQRVAEQYFAHLETMDAPAQASWRERLEGRLNEAEERLAAWSSRARKAARTKDEQQQAPWQKPSASGKPGQTQALGRSARLPPPNRRFTRGRIEVFPQANLCPSLRRV